MIHEVKEMIKKYCVLLCLALLCGCESSTTSTEQTETPKETGPKKIEQLTLHQLWNGDGNEHGFYHMSMRNVGDQGVGNLYYYDYETKQEIFLCDKPECQHMDESCTSYIDGDTYISAHLFVQQDHFYLLTSDLASLDQQQRHGSQLIQYDLNGKNKTVLATLPEGYSFDSNEVCVGGSFLFLPMSKNEEVSIGDNSFMVVAQQKKLFRVDLSNGDTEEVMDLHGLDIVSAKDQQLILVKYQYEQDPEELLKNQEYEAYDRVMYNATLAYTTYDINTKAFSKEVPSTTNTTGTYMDEHIYELQGTDLYALSLQDGTSTKVATIPHHDSIQISDAQNGYLIIQASGQDFETAGIEAAYRFDPTSQELQPFTLITGTPKSVVAIYGETKDHYFVYYDHTQHLETTWAGTEQYVKDSVSMGLIKKDDYWNGLANYIPIKTITLE